MEELSQEENNFHRIQLLTETCLLRALRQLLRQGPRIVTSDGRSYLLPFSKFIADNDVKRCLNEYFNLRRGSPLGQGHTFDLPNENTMTNIDGLDLENVLVMVCIYIKKDAEPKDILKRCTEIYNELNQKQKLSNVDFNAMFVRLKYLSLEISDYLQDQELKQNMSALIPRCKKQSIATDLPFANIFENKLNIDEINTIVGKYCTTFDKIGISKTLSTDSGVGIEIQSGPEAYNTDMPSPHNEDPKKKNDGESILTSHISCESGFSEDTPEQEPEVAIMGVTKINGEDEPKAKKRRIDITNDKLPAPNVSPESSSVDGEIITLTATTDYELGDIEQNTSTSDIHQHADIMKDCSGHDNNTNKSPASVPMKGESGPLQVKKRRIDITPNKLPLSNVSPGMSNSVDEEIIALYATTDYELNERGHIEHNTSTSDIHQQAMVVEDSSRHDTHTNMSTASEPFKGHMSLLLIFHCSADEALARSIAAGLEDSFGFVPTVMALTTMQAYGVHNFRNLKDTFTILGRGMLIVTNDTSEEFQDYARRFVKELPPDLSETITLVLQTVTKEDFGIDETFTGKLLEFKHKNDVNIPKISLALNDAISVRGYQKELAEKACDGHNVIIMAPTNAGKTRVACKIVEMHFQNFNTRTPRVLFLVENEALALQQGQVCEKLLRWKRTKVFTGNTHRSKSQYIWDYLDKRDIFVVTAQILVNALKAGKIESLQEFSLIVFDECHHSKKQHMYNELMSKYLDLKIKCDLSGSDLPQIVGLTASLGVGGKTLAVYGLKYMKQIVANMDAKFLCTIRSEASKTELRKYVSSPKEALIGVDSRANDVFKKALEDIAQNISEYINTDQTVMGASIEDKEQLQDCNIPLTFGTDAYQQWSSEFAQTIAKIDSDDIRRVLEPCSKYLEVYNKALLVYSDARLTEAMAILSEFIDDVREVETDHSADSFLLGTYNDLLQRTSGFEDRNPKLMKLQEILEENLLPFTESRGIIFVKTRELAAALVDWINNTEPISALNAAQFVGQGNESSDGGMTKVRQKDVLGFFKKGVHRVVIATSVAEEGLDITQCNLVIRYMHVTNEIVRLQSRGRARTEDSKYFVIAEKGSPILDKEEKNKRCEEIMNEIVPDLQVYLEKPENNWETEMLEMQKAMKNKEDQMQRERLDNMSDDACEFQCMKCSSFICLSEDIRTIKGSFHIVVNIDVNGRIRLQRGKPGFTETDGVEYGGKIFCMQSDCQKELGTLCTYRDIVFPVIKLKLVRVVNKNGDGNKYKKWKQLTCRIHELSDDEFYSLVEERKTNLFQ